VDLTSLRERLFIDVIRWAPKSTYSHVVGYLAGRTLPRRLRGPVYRTFARRVGADLGEVERPLEDYPSLGAFFVRRLKAGARAVASDRDAVVSPCDGTVSQFGTISAGQLIQAKGIHYPLFGLVADRPAAARFAGGSFLTIYLAPRDYHRVHFSVGGKVTGYQHVPGALFPVNAAAVNHVGALFTRNERLVTYQDTDVGEVATVMVGATAVGRISVSYDAVETHSKKRGRPGPRVRYAVPHVVRRGDELGAFHLGSTVILLFEPGAVSFAGLELGQTVRMGEPVARRLAGAGQRQSATSTGTGGGGRAA
jgi:phosphatidylserine decarboxylase